MESLFRNIWRWMAVDRVAMQAKKLADNPAHCGNCCCKQREWAKKPSISDQRRAPMEDP